MNKSLFRFIIIVVLFSMAACSEKFNIAAPYKNITVIYAFLDKADTAHYIRVQKAFLDQNKSALTMAQNADSSFYKNINVRINRISLNDTTHVFDTIHLNRVNLNLEGYPKQSGVFFDSTNYAYKFTNSLDPNFLYRIIVTNLTTGQVDSSTSPIIDDITPAAYNVDVIDDQQLNLQGMEFSSTLPFSTFQINVSYTGPDNYYFQQEKCPAALADVIVRFNWVDSNIANGTETARYYDLDIGNQPFTGISQNNGVSVAYNIKDLQLYNALATGMGTAPAFTVRLLDRVEIFGYVSTLDYYNYQQASLTQGLGITGNEIEPVYTNVKGPDALGLFTARGMHSGLITITPNTVDSLILSPILTNAHILGTVYH